LPCQQRRLIVIFETVYDLRGCFFHPEGSSYEPCDTGCQHDLLHGRMTHLLRHEKSRWGNGSYQGTEANQHGKVASHRINSCFDSELVTELTVPWNLLNVM
jgi:hypothetical protein